MFVAVEKARQAGRLAGWLAAAVLSPPDLSMNYVSEEASMATAHEQGDLHPVTLAILMSINVTDRSSVLMIPGLRIFI